MAFWYSRRWSFVLVTACALVLFIVITFGHTATYISTDNPRLKWKNSNTVGYGANRKIRTSNNLQLFTFNDVSWEVNGSICNEIEAKKGRDNFQKAPLKTLNGTVEMYLMDPKTDYVSQQVKKKQEHDSFVYRIIYKFIRNEPDVNFIDFGANLGLFSLQLAALNRHVISVEASYECVQHECASVLENRFQDRMTIVHNAVGADHTDAKFHMLSPGGDFGISFVETNDNEFDRHQVRYKTLPFKRTVVVKSVTLDDLLSLPNFQNRFKRVFIKIDIEGMEHNALRGAEQFFKNVDVRGIFMEWAFHEKRASGTFIMSKMAAWGFEVWDCDSVFGNSFFRTNIDKPCRHIDLNHCMKCPINVVWLPKSRPTI